MGNGLLGWVIALMNGYMLVFKPYFGPLLSGSMVNTLFLAFLVLNGY